MTTRRAFTLIEVLIALALMMALLYAFFQFLNGSSVAQQVTREAAARQLNARTLCDMIERDLTCSLTGDAVNGSGIKGSATELHILTRAVPAALATAGMDDRSALTDLEAADYNFQASAKEVAIARTTPARDTSVKPDSTTLAAKRAMRDDATSQKSEQVSQHETVSPIERLRYRYYDGSTWQESFDSLAADHLPVAVEISLWLHPIPKPSSEASLDDSAPNVGAQDAPGFGGDETGVSASESDRVMAADEDSPATDEEKIPPPDVVRIVIIPDAVAGGGS